MIDPMRTPAPNAWDGVENYARNPRVEELNEVFKNVAGQELPARQGRWGWKPMLPPVPFVPSRFVQ